MKNQIYYHPQCSLDVPLTRDQTQGNGRLFNTLKKLWIYFIIDLFSHGCHVLWWIQFILMLRLAFCQKPNYINAFDMLPEDRRICSVHYQAAKMAFHQPCGNLTGKSIQINFVIFQPFLELDWWTGPFLVVGFIKAYNKVEHLLIVIHIRHVFFVGFIVWIHILYKHKVQYFDMLFFVLITFISLLIAFTIPMQIDECQQ